MMTQESISLGPKLLSSQEGAVQTFALLGAPRASESLGAGPVPFPPEPPESCWDQPAALGLPSMLCAVSELLLVWGLWGGQGSVWFHSRVLLPPFLLLTATVALPGAARGVSEL